jgi:hypothetical protein
MSIDYKQWYAEAKDELRSLEERREDLTRQTAENEGKIAGLIQTINAMAGLAGEDPVPSPPGAGEVIGITDRIRHILRESGQPLSTTEIRDLLESAGCDLKGYSNPMATIHTVLRRLQEGEEIKEKHLKIDGKKYRAFIGAVGQGRGRFMGVAVVRRKQKEAPAP